MITELSMKTRLILISFIAIIVGCVDQQRDMFISAVHDHREYTVKTTDALIASVHDELRINAPKMTPEEIQATMDLIDNLEFVKQGSIVIELYVNQKADPNTLSKALRDRWELRRHLDETTGKQ